MGSWEYWDEEKWVLSNGISFSAPEPPPKSLVLTGCPKSLAACEGRYDLSSQPPANGEPVWEKENGEYWLYAGPNSKWYVDTSEAQREGFRENAGFLAVERTGCWPHQCRGNWEFWDGTRWPLLKSISFTVGEDAERRVVALEASLEASGQRLTASHHEVAQLKQLLEETTRENDGLKARLKAADQAEADAKSEAAKARQALAEANEKLQKLEVQTEVLRLNQTSKDTKHSDCDAHSFGTADDERASFGTADDEARGEI
jgi:hypothetical protein